MGSKFVPCMRETTQYPTTTTFGNCYQSTESTCTEEQLCGFGGFGGKAPDQTFRFFTSIFLHGGVIHILMNLITHIQFGREIECRLGLIRYVILYLVAGVWGFILSGVLSGLTSCKLLLYEISHLNYDISKFNLY
jgi:membrane associated rhomboid family serine protease